MNTASGTHAEHDALADLPRPVRRRRKAGKPRVTAIGLVAPSVLLLALINAYPFVYAFWQSLHNGTLISAGDFVGLTNYSDVLSSPAFWKAVDEKEYGHGPE